MSYCLTQRHVSFSFCTFSPVLEKEDAIFFSSGGLTCNETFAKCSTTLQQGLCYMSSVVSLSSSSPCPPCTMCQAGVGHALSSLCLCIFGQEEQRKGLAAPTRAYLRAQ